MTSRRSGPRKNHNTIIIMSRYTDTHSHIYDAAFGQGGDGAVARAAAAGVGRILLPAIDSGSHEAMLALCERHPDSCFPMMGLHPTSVNGNPDYRRELELVEKHLEESASGAGPRFVAVGEVGLDLHWSRDFLGEQTEAFERQIELALHYDLPLAIHTRDAWAEMRDVLSRYAGRGLRGSMHAFSGMEDDYLYIKRCGDFVFGVGGPVTYKKSALAELLRRIPLDDIVLETDAPYLPPTPHRGERNESAYIPLIAAKVAEIYGVTIEEVAACTSRNAARIFGI